jgi:hypothetical protein
MTAMNAILINAAERSVAAIELENTLQAMYDIIGCSLIQVVEYRDELIVCDEEARLKPWDHGFELADWKICGNALILGENDDGDFAGTKLTAEDVAKDTRFFGREERMPEPAIRVIGVW